jgi:MtrB/PioB family decaheme-associated outer membrane protein
MRKQINTSFQMTALAAALALCYGPALADDTDAELTALTKPSSNVSVGLGGWSNDRNRSGMYDGMREAGGYLLIDADILSRDDATGTWLGLKARNLGLENFELKGEWLKQGDIGASIEYNRIISDSPYTINTGLQGLNTTSQRVVNIVPGQGSSGELGTQRDRLQAQFLKHFGNELKFEASFRNEEKNGTRLYGRGGAAEFAVEPIDSVIRLLETTLSYNKDKLQLSGGYYGTSYSTENKLVTTVGTATFRLSQPLDNMSHELFMNGGYNFTPTTRGTFKVSYSLAKQDERLPTADVPGLASPLAPVNLDGKLATTLAEIGITAKPLPKLSVLGNLRYRDFDDKTPVRQYVFGATPMFNTPFSYRNVIGKLEGTYRLDDGYSLLGGVEHNGQDRTTPTAAGVIRVPFVTKLDTTSYRLQVRKSMSETVNGTLAYVNEQRSGKNYFRSGEAEENLIHPLHIADRKRDKVRAMIDWSATEKLNLQFAAESSTDKYGNGPNGNPLGIQKGTGSFFSADANYQVQTDWELNGWVSLDESKADETTYCGGTLPAPVSCDEGTGGTNRKYNSLKETGTSFGVGIKGKVSSRLKIGGNVEQFRSINKYNQTFTAGVSLPTGLAPTPDITNNMLKFKIFTEYAMQKNTDLRFDLIHEKYNTNDWTWNMLTPAGTSTWAYGSVTDGTTVNASPKQQSTFLGVRFKYKF